MSPDRRCVDPSVCFNFSAIASILPGEFSENEFRKNFAKSERSPSAKPWRMRSVGAKLNISKQEA
jgi:hypothetical protein